jgi:glycosyltransferase involved in cell wall biosynthesis
MLGSRLLHALIMGPGIKDGVCHHRYRNPVPPRLRACSRSASYEGSSTVSMVTSVSVVIPTRDRSALLRQSLRSVLAQSDVSLEVIVVDDGSSDDTGAVVTAVDDLRVVLLRHDRSQGLSASRNHGAQEAKGEWLAFIDDDDLWAPRKLSGQVQAANASGRTWVYTGCVNVDDGLTILGGDPPPSPEEVVRLIYRRNVIPGGGSNVVLHRDAFRRAGPFNVSLRSAADWEMWIRLAKQGPPAWVPEPLMAYRYHSTNMSLDVDAMIEELATIEELHQIRIDWGRLHRWLAESFLRMDADGRALGQFARAALHGQARGVASDLAAILRRRVARLLGGRADKYLRRETSVDAAWLAEASTWLDELVVPTPFVGDRDAQGDVSRKAAQ